MNLAGFRDAVADHMTTTFAGSETGGLNVSVHEGEFDLDAVRRYSKSDPALVIALLEAETDKNPIGDGILFDTTMVGVVLARSRAGEPKDSRALRIGTYVMREIAKNGQTFGINLVQVQAPTEIKGRSLYSAELDQKLVSLFGISWKQMVECTPDAEEPLDDLDLIHVDYDLGPEPDGDYEAEDDIDLT